MNSDCCVHFWEGLSHVDRFSAGWDIDSRIKYPSYSRLAGARDDLLKIFFEGIKIEVAVRIDQQLGDSRYAQPIFQDILDAILVRRLRVDTDDGLSPRKTDQQPPAILQVEFEPICGHQTCDL